MAERYSTVPNTSAFQERANAELTILNGRLHERLKRDLTRIYKESLFVDLDISLNSGRIQTHRSLLEARAPRFYSEICATRNRNGENPILDKINHHFIETFIREVYHENVLKHKEDAVIAQIKKVQQASLRDQEPGSPESDVFLTPKASPSEVPQSYSQNVSCDFPKSDVTTIANSNGSYRKGNALYYSLVHVEDELNGNNEEKCSVLEKELAEQDELFKSFQSIIIKEGKNKAKKPASLNFASTKRVKSKIVTSDDKPPSVLKFPNTRLCKIAASQDNQKETKQSCYFQTEIKPPRTSYVKSPRPVKKVTKTHSQSNVENAAWRVLDEMTTKKCIVDKRDNEEVMSNPEVDCAGLDSCLEAGSSGYITGGGSPKDATGSEGFGIDTTEAASSEDIPHDNERFPASSSASSDAGTWDSTFHGNDEQTFVESHNNGTKCKTSCFNERTTNSDSVIFFTSEKKSEGKSGSVVLNVCNLINEEPSQNLAKANINKCIESLSGELGDKNISEPPPDLKTPHSSRIETADVLVTSNFVKEEVCINDCTSVSIDDDKIEVICGGLQNVSNSIGENVISSPRTNCFIDAASLSDENEVNILPSCNSFNGTKLVDVKDELNDSGMKSELYDCGMKSELEEVNMDKQETVEKMEGKPNLIRRNTFELEADDDKLALLRQEYEKRQGSTLFQSSSSSDISLGNSNEVSNVSRVISNVSPKIDHPDTLIIDGSLGTYVPVLTDNDIQSPDSLNNDTHVKEYLEQDSANQQKVNVQQTESIIVSNDSNMNPESFLNDIGTDTNLETCSLTSLETEKIMFKSNHQLPLHNFNKFESLPIVSGSSIVSDVSSEYNHSVTSSPLVSRRKNEYAPIVSGGFDIVDTVHDTQVTSAQPKSLSPLTRSWIVDMSDSGRSSSSIRPHSRNSVDRNRSSSSGLGFFIPLDDPLSSLENVSSASNDKKESTVKQDIELNSSCGFFVDLKSDNPSQEVSKSGDPPQGEKKLFSMFIDIGDSCNTDSTSPRSKTSSPFLTGKKFRPKNHADRFTLKNEKNISTSSDSSMEINEHPEVSKGKLLFSDESLPNSSQAVSDSSLQDVSLKKQSFFMFIEANSSPVPKKRNLPSGLRPSSQRHSWNVDYKKTDSQNLPPITRREHKRANSLSVDKSNIPETNREEKFQSGPASIEESGIRHQENNHKLMMSSWHGSIKPSTELSRIINGTRHESKGSKNINGESVDKVEELSCSIKSDEVYDTSNATNVSSKDDHNRTFVLDDVSKVVNANTNDLEVSTPSHDVVSDLSKDETETDPIKGSSTFSNLTDKSEDSGGAGGPNEATPKASASQQTLANGESLQFVKLSDMDKEPLKAWSSAGATVEKRTSRMSRSIPEGSWLEERMNAQSSTSRSLSRLFPHLYPRRTPEPEEPDIHSSAHSSLQSSFDPSGLECSTEGTEGSSVSGGPCSRLGEDLLRMFLEEISPDVTVEVGGRRIKAHKCILSSRCQYFAGILSGGWVESAGNVISLQGFSYNTVHFALCHIYSGAINVPDSINIVELATLADMLCLEGLKEVITYTLKVKHCHFFHKPCPTCTVGVLECLPLAAAYGLDEIYRKSLRWITRHFVRVWPAKEFANLPKELQDKCYKQHIIHMCPENVLDTIMCCNKLEATIPNVRWAQSVFSLNSKLHDAAVKYLMQHFSAVVSSDMFLSVGKEDAWTVGRIEGTLVSSAHTLSAEQACLSYSKLKNLLVTISTSTTSDWKPEFVDLLCRLDTTVEDCLVRQVGRAARTSAWTLLDLQLRRKIQDMACVAYLPGDERRRPRHSSIGKHGELPKPQSNDVSNLKSKGSDSVRKEAPTPQTKPLTPTLISQAPRPKKLSQIKSRYLEPKPVRKELSNVDSNKMTNTFGQRRVAPGKQLISSSDSSRTSSPATTRALVTRSRQRTKESDRMTMSTDSLCEMKPVKSMSTKSVPENRTHHTPIPLRKSLPSSKVEPYKVKSAESIQDKHSGTVSLAKCKTFTSCTARKLEGAPSTEPYKVKSSESISERQLSKSKPVAYCASRRSEGSPSAMKPLRSAVSSPSARRNQVSSQNPSAKQPGESLNRNSTFRVSQKSSSPSKMSPMSSRELFGKTRGGNVNQKIIGKPILNNNNSPILNGKSTTGVSAKSKTLSVGPRSGTFLKEEPTVLKKHDKVIE